MLQPLGAVSTQVRNAGDYSSMRRGDAEVPTRPPAGSKHAKIWPFMMHIATERADSAWSADSKVLVVQNAPHKTQ